jgi:hypothetical protein
VTPGPGQTPSPGPRRRSRSVTVTVTRPAVVASGLAERRRPKPGPSSENGANPGRTRRMMPRPQPPLGQLGGGRGGPGGRAGTPPLRAPRPFGSLRVLFPPWLPMPQAPSLPPTLRVRPLPSPLAASVRPSAPCPLRPSLCPSVCPSVPPGPPIPGPAESRVADSEALHRIHRSPVAT